MKRPHEENQPSINKVSWSQQDIFAFYQSYKPEKKNPSTSKDESNSTGSTAEQFSTDIVQAQQWTAPTELPHKKTFTSTTEAYSSLLDELQLATKDLLEAEEQLKNAQARVLQLHEALMAQGEELYEESENRFHNLKSSAHRDDPKTSPSKNISRTKKSLSLSEAFLKEDESRYEEDPIFSRK